jgi:cytochrome c nitrite reductase small subunit
MARGKWKTAMTRTSWLLLLTAVLIGAAIGLGAFTFVYAKGYSYLTNDPGACANCHIMDEHYGAWLKSSHRAVAACNDCHTPHDFVGKWTVKAKNGFWHSFYFTTGNFPYPIRITEPNHEVVEQACRGCHESITSFVDHPVVAPAAAAEPALALRDPQPITCTKCHRYVGHWVR